MTPCEHVIYLQTSVFVANERAVSDPDPRDDGDLIDDVVVVFRSNGNGSDIGFKMRPDIGDLKLE